jgi:mevalonate kinase
MKVSQIFTNVVSKLFAVTPDAIEKHFSTTGVFALPEFETELSDERVAEIEAWDIEKLRVIVTPLLDAVGVSKAKIEKIIKKG